MQPSADKGSKAKPDDVESPPGGGGMGLGGGGMDSSGGGMDAVGGGMTVSGGINGVDGGNEVSNEKEVGESKDDEKK